jgi:hypothetical protein
LESVPKGVLTGSALIVHDITPPGSTKFGTHEAVIVFRLLMLAYSVGVLIGNDCEFTRNIIRPLELSTMSVQLMPL